jgi:phosphonate transport system substrate-binding protein
MSQSGRPDTSRRQLLKVLSASSGLCLAGLAPITWAEVTPGRVWRLGVVPQLTPLETTQRWAPVTQVLGQAGIPCQLVVFSSIALFEAAFLKGDLDFAYLNPYHMVMARRAQRYEALLRDRRPLEGVVLVRRDSPVEKPEQLGGARISFPSPNAFAASLYIRAALERQYKVAFQTHYAGTHRNAVRQVLAGDSVAACAVKTTLEQEPPEVRNQLRVIYTTPALAPHPLAAHPRIPQGIRNTLVEALTSLAQTSATQPLMAGIQMPNPIRADYTAEYAPLERLGIEKFIVNE